MCVGIGPCFFSSTLQGAVACDEEKKPEKGL